jgi:hypothetical protein
MNARPTVVPESREAAIRPPPDPAPGLELDGEYPIGRDPLAREPVPCGYAVRLVLSHHLGGWKPCAGPPRCEHCAGLARARKSIARRRGETGEIAQQSRPGMRSRLRPTPGTGRRLPIRERPPAPERKGPRHRPADASPITAAVPTRQQKFSIGSVAAALRDDGYAPIAVRLAGLRASYRLRLGGALSSNAERELRRLHFLRRRELRALTHAYRAWP